MIMRSRGTAVLAIDKLRSFTSGDVGRQLCFLYLGGRTVRYPAPRAASVGHYGFGLAILYEPVQNRCYGCHGVFVAGEQCRHFLLEVITNVARIHGAS